MSKVKNKENELEFNTYCIFTNGEQHISQIIGLIFKDYIGNLKTKAKQSNY